MRVESRQRPNEIDDDRPGFRCAVKGSNLMNYLATELFTEISTIPCVNGHSHLPPEQERLAEEVDALVLFKHAYLNADLVAAGITPEARAKLSSTAVPMDERWHSFDP